MKERIFGVSQIEKNIEYRWLFKEQQILSALGIKCGSLAEEADMDCDFPIHSNGYTSSTYFVELDGYDAIYDYLMKKADGPDSEDPTLSKIGNYILIVNTDYESITKEYLDMFCIDTKDPALMQYDTRKFEILKKAEIMKKKGFDRFDYENPFDGQNSNMTYSQFCVLFNYVMSRTEDPIEGVYIRGLVKPRNCEGCTFKSSDLYCKITKGNIIREDGICSIPCPIVEVPAFLLSLDRKK